ncbi:cardiolipin synthase [Sulfurovum sp. NBC37-1]|uniref:cardiolipin synthase n=1 Tax=Sulfurovum sp. (strain NBC37-1) TaxID=387093 RepID=UPI00015877CF|nr:cardiolipin synthase [Sulfurovum sp. NBC37-1]BAF71958.1 cardiolipin synthetase [Sulfurovum sp. NBC37-1]
MNFWVIAGALTHLSILLLILARILTRPHRQPASRIAWIVVVISLPILGILAYIGFGEVNIGRKRVEKLQKIIEKMRHDLPTVRGNEPHLATKIPKPFTPVFAVGRSINGFPPVAGNIAQLPPDSNTSIDSIISDIDAAKEHVHLSFYIWLSDRNGLKVVEALKRAASRGVTCRVMADDIGSRDMVRSRYWKEMEEAGVRLAVLLPIGNILLRPFRGRVDLRNHRKIVVIDNSITYSGSQNCADPEFRVKPKFAPWVDIMMRFEGPVAIQNQYVFASDWMLHTDESLYELLLQPITMPMEDGFTAQVVATGPTERPTAIPEMFESLLFTAHERVIITTPYFIPDESLQNALCTTAYRGVETIMIFPRRNDSWVVAAASHSYYEDLLKAGVKIYEYEGGLLHTKSVTVDDEITLIGSANMDRRSFELNYENNILYHDSEMTVAIRQRQEQYLFTSVPVTLEEVRAWPFRRRLWNNTIAILGPLL